MFKRLAIVIPLALLGAVLVAQGSGTPSTLRVLTDANNYLVTSSAAVTPPLTSTVFANARLTVDANGYLVITDGSGAGFAPAGTNGTGTVTPLGTNQALTFTGTPSSVVVNHLHTLATGTGSTGNFSQVVGTVDTSSGGTGATPTQTALGTLSSNPTVGGASSYTPAGTINTPTFTGSSSVTSAETFTGSALGTHQHAVTATGTNGTSAVTGTLNSFDNRSAWMKVIFCVKD